MTGRRNGRRGRRELRGRRGGLGRRVRAGRRRVGGGRLRRAGGLGPRLRLRRGRDGRGLLLGAGRRDAHGRHGRGCRGRGGGGHGGRAAVGQGADDAARVRHGRAHVQRTPRGLLRRLGGVGLLGGVGDAVAVRRRALGGRVLRGVLVRRLLTGRGLRQRHGDGRGRGDTGLRLRPGALGARHQEQVVVFGRGGGGVEVGVRVRGGRARLLHRACVLRLPLARDLAGVGHAYPSPIGCAPSLPPASTTSVRAARHERVRTSAFSPRSGPVAVAFATGGCGLRHVARPPCGVRPRVPLRGALRRVGGEHIADYPPVVERSASLPALP
ncbi:hypothetical protein BG846_01015 [Streptomyces fradiae ATCC 10745 = DSM 40063]|uniref:Uncharacterized protein n=1 Tax=Streptomyces fradiae ATCC 10745 = DSM 40063 TaxID=1319510 RepID=A0A1Y2P2C1_STRFR|nr:hypothetical protein BG846_01015 [Streptomyces fradiae ATCC 10745 = DSM 40063]